MPSTLSDLERASLGDILFNIDLAFVFTEGLDISSFIADTRTFYAVTRCLEIISEASRRLSPETKGRHPAIPWRKVAGSGNIYRHSYEEVAQRAVWNTVHEALPALRAIVEAELHAPGEDPT